jgi:phosphoribosyl 1,2-cyclic phosphodiesterase
VTVATDLGHMPDDCIPSFLDADAVVLESNHDEELLWESGRPPELIQRILGPDGHLSNESAAEALAEIVGRSHPGRVQHVVLAHLSRDCNTPRLALAAQGHLARRRSDPVRVSAARQDAAGPMIEM